MIRLLKPSKLDRLGRQNTRRLAKARAKRLEREQEQFLWQIVRVAVFNRDKGRCRVCERRLKLHSRDPYEVMEAHHVKYRSANGSDEMSNIVALCPVHHRAEHQHTLSLTGTAGRLTIKWLEQ